MITQVPKSEMSKPGGNRSHLEQRAGESSMAGKCDKPHQETDLTSVNVQCIYN